VPEFTNPFIGKVPDRMLTSEELIRAIRLNLAAEHEAVHIYMAHADATDNPLAKKVLIDIANEERVHAGEFARLLSILTGDEDSFLAEGAEEVDQMAAGLVAPASEKPEGGATEEATTGTAGTVGSLKK
jgi:rubrerythrin